VPFTGTTRNKRTSRFTRPKPVKCGDYPLPDFNYQHPKRDPWYFYIDQKLLPLENYASTPSVEPLFFTYADARRTVPLKLIGSDDNPLAPATRRELRTGCRSMRAVLLDMRNQFPHDSETGKRKPRSTQAKNAEPINSRLARKILSLLDDESMNAAADNKPIPLAYNPKTDTEFISGSGDRESPVSHVMRTYRDLNYNNRLSWLARSEVQLWAFECDHMLLVGSTTNEEAERVYLALNIRITRLINALKRTKHVRSGFFTIEVSQCWYKGQRAVSVHVHLILEPEGNANLEVTVSTLWSMTQGKEFSGTVHTSPTLRGGPAGYDSVLNIFQYAAGTTSIHGLRLSKFMLGFFRPYYFASTPWAESRAARKRENGFWCKDTFRLFLVHTETAGQKRRFFGAWDGRTAAGKAAKKLQGNNHSSKSSVLALKVSVEIQMSDTRTHSSLEITTRENAKRVQQVQKVQTRLRRAPLKLESFTHDAVLKPKSDKRVLKRQIARCSNTLPLESKRSSARSLNPSKSKHLRNSQ